MFAVMIKHVKPSLIAACFLEVAIVLDLYACLASIRPLEVVVKPLLMSLLALTSAAWLMEHGGERRTVTLLMAAQLLGCAGDTLLMGSGLPFFGAGMGAFLAGHICYLCLFGKKAWPGLGRKVWIPALLVMAVVLLVVVRVIGIQGALLVPMLVYGFALLLLIFSGLCGVVRLRGGLTWWMILAGGVLFTVSDAIIALRTFGLEETPALGFTIMLTYILAQVSLAFGACHLND